MNDFLLSQIEEGKYFNLGAFLDDNYILLSPETPVDQPLLDRLQRWGYNYVYSNGDITDRADSEGGINGDDVEVANLNAQFKEREELEQAESKFREMVEFTEKIFTQFVTRGDLPHGMISNKVKEFIETVKRYRHFLLRYNEFQVNINYIVVHSVKTTIVGTILGLEMHLPPHKMIELATTCLLHEIGMIKLPSQLYMTDKLLNEKERKAITAHTALGFKILRTHDYPMAVCLGVLESHENIDGSGYPRNLTGERISQYAKIVSVASSFAAMNSDRPFRVALDGHHAVVELLKNRGTRYDAGVLSGLVKALSVYPIGTFVQVENGAQGMVVKTFQEHPRTPLVKLLLGPKGGQYMENPVVNTLNEEYRIVGVIPNTKASKLREALKGE
ncbi:HD-GYP domain-containing protein [Salinispira pacifica]|uniref:Response regulator/sensory box/HDIG domain protein n=1 Tax=Salinispira pacifica TaxID=1307761 RepID=V5WG71_9SPIO|nr:HD domain-containing phosphohydrolase [Salinispira pacifica]AHC14793.1 Response regulator/sensory box/HDIG domain protein [Salinispira pacifica]